MGSMRYVLLVVGALALCWALYVGLTSLARWVYIGSRPGPDPKDYDNPGSKE